MGIPRAIVPGRAYMVTRRCADRRFFLQPDEQMNNAFIYCLVLAAQKAGVEVFFAIACSNHWHGGIIDKTGQLPVFLEHFHKLLAKHHNACRGRWENFWDPRQTSVVELCGPEDAMAKLAYALGNPVKDHLVAHARSWPGVSTYLATLHGGSLKANKPGVFFRRNNLELPSSVTLAVARAPGFEHLEHAQYAEKVREAVEAIEREAEKERATTGRALLGRRAVLRQRWTDRPASKEPHRMMSPRVASVDRWRRVETLMRNKRWLAAYRAALDALRRGAAVIFPAGTWLLRRLAGVASEGVPPQPAACPQPS